MNDPFEILERDLFEAAIRSRSHRLARRARLPRRTPRGRLLIAFVVLCLGSATAALAAAGVFHTGAPVEPASPAVARAGNGVAIAARTRLMPIRVPDPGGGLPWGIKVIHTTREETCVQVGRVDYGTVGALGQDSAFANDGRFHPFSPNYEGPLNCGAADANGNAFIHDILTNTPASAYHGCRLPTRTLLAALPRHLPARFRQAFLKQAARVPECPAADLRNVYFGLLGPDAVSVTYATPDGHTRSAPTAGNDGAYLIVEPRTIDNTACSPRHPVCPGDEMGEANGIWANDIIQAIHYRNAPTCRRSNQTLAPLPQCPNVGYLARPAPRQPSPAQVRSPITVTTRYIHIGLHREQQDAVISFISHTAITNSNDYYYIELDNPRPEAPGQLSLCDPSSASDALTDTDYQPGQRVTITLPVAPCKGTATGTVTLVIHGDAADHLPGGIGSHSVPVGTFTATATPDHQ